MQNLEKISSSTSGAAVSPVTDASSRRAERKFSAESSNISASVSEIAVAMKKILTDNKLRAKFAKKSLEIASEHDLERTIDKFINIYNRVIKK